MTRGFRPGSTPAGLSSWLVAMFYKGTLRRAPEGVGEALKGRAEGD